MNCYLGQKSSKGVQVCGIRLETAALWGQRQDGTGIPGSLVPGEANVGLLGSRTVSALEPHAELRFRPKLPPTHQVALGKSNPTLDVTIATWGQSLRQVPLLLSLVL